MGPLLITSRGPPCRLSKQKYFSTKQWEPIAAVCDLRLKEASAWLQRWETMKNRVPNENDAMEVPSQNLLVKWETDQIELVSVKEESSGLPPSAPPRDQPVEGITPWTGPPKRPSSPRRSSWRTPTERRR